jgi:hypothetical protein
MFRPTIARYAIRAAAQSSRPTTVVSASRPVTSTFFRSLSSTPRRAKDDDENINKDPFLSATDKAPQGASGTQEGQFARTDENVKIEYPDDDHMPRSPIVRGRGGVHFKRTLAQFSLENRVSVVTGGARGLGLVMAQALVSSGSDLAIVDLNRM